MRVAVLVQVTFLKLGNDVLPVTADNTAPDMKYANWTLYQFVEIEREKYRPFARRRVTSESFHAAANIKFSPLKVALLDQSSFASLFTDHLIRMATRRRFQLKNGLLKFTTVRRLATHFTLSAGR